MTQPLRFGVGRLRVNARPTSTGGALRAEILDADGTPLPGYAANECQAVAEDAIDGTIRWTETDKVPATSADGARIRFVMKNVQIFSFWIEEEDNFNMDRNRL